MKNRDAPNLLRATGASLRLRQTRSRPCHALAFLTLPGIDVQRDPLAFGPSNH